MISSSAAWNKIAAALVGAGIMPRYYFDTIASVTFLGGLEFSSTRCGLAPIGSVER